MRTNTSPLSAFIALALVFSGCAVDPAAEAEGTQVSAITGGCHTDCPKCHPGEVCSLIACRQVCNAHEACVQNMLCMQGYSWSPARCGCTPDHGPSLCQTDADCRAVADYCTGCDCRALSTRESLPTCSGPGVRCLADPCANLQAVCLHGSCSLQ